MTGYAVEVVASEAVGEWLWAEVREVDGVYAIPSAYAAYRPYCFG